jgi:hypothetical protein
MLAHRPRCIGAIAAAKRGAPYGMDKLDLIGLPLDILEGDFVGHRSP